MTAPAPSPLTLLFRQSFMALVIKVGAAGTSFLMFLALAQALPADAYGQFGFAFALATLLSVLASFGQRGLALKYASIYLGNDDVPALAGLLRFGFAFILGLGVLACVAVAIVGAMMGNPYLIAVGPLALALSIAEYQAHFLRAYGNMALALAPRDIGWRVLVILIALAAMDGLLQMTTAQTALALMAATLLLISAAQLFFYAPMRRLIRTSAPVPDTTRSEWRHASVGLWGTSFVQTAGPNLAVVILGLFTTPDETGPFFSALRIAMVLSLFLIAANMAGGSLIARSYAARDRALLQRICTSVARLTSIPTALCFLAFLIMGKDLLRLFGDSFDSAFLPLVILSAGYLLSTFMGPTVQVMETTGHERHYLRILTVTTCSVLALMPVAILLADMIGAALMISANMVISRGLCYRFILRTLHIAPGIFARHRGGADHD
ncbi:lipopolysaccharide biosynthesis protein [Roseobacter sp. A03A-229]